MIYKLPEKIERIKLLKSLGYNTPRMLFIPRYESYLYKDDILEFVKTSKLVNIRTYDTLDNNREGYNRPHATKILAEDAYTVLRGFTDQYNCIIDLESPDDGMYAGNIVFDGGSIIIDYCVRNGDAGAVVRNADKTLVLNNPQSVCSSEVPQEIKTIIDQASKFPNKGFVLEWSYQCNPCGLLGVNDIWWEYRSYKEG